jgi:lauroyl/myristoyl acyltransferase
MAVSTKPDGTEPARVFSMEDVGVLVGVPLLIGLAWLLPENYWPSIGQVLSPFAISGLTPDREATLGSIQQTLGARLPATDARKILHSMASEGILSFFQVLKCYRFDRWTPAVRIANVERVEQARQSGRGVILWVAHAFHGHLGAKVAFRRAGLSVSHLSRPTHGFSSSRFGVRYLNWMQRLVEDRHLAERIQLPLDGQNAALNVVVRRLRANSVVSITAQRGTGRTVDAPFLDGRLLLAPGGPALAQMTGATLLPVFAFRDDDGVVDVTIEPPIEVAADAPRDAAVADAVRRYAAVLEPYVLRYPGQWLGWPQL